MSASPEPTTVLVCATDTQGGAPRVVLADGSYETGAERVFWRRSRDGEVLRLPLQTPVSIRPVRHFPQQRSATAGEQRLLAALAPQPERLEVAAQDDVLPALAQRLTGALAAGESTAAEALLALMWQRLGLAVAHTVLGDCVAELTASSSREGSVILRERQVIATTRTVLERLRATTSRPAATDPVVLAVPVGDRHTLALSALAHELKEAGRSSLVVDDLPVDDLAALAGTSRIRAVVVSAHLPLTALRIRALVAAVRRASPMTQVIVGGPGVPGGVRGPDLVTGDTAELIAFLEAGSGALSPREVEVLLAVAEGRTNGEIANALGLSPATVKTYLDHVFIKTGTEHRAAAVASALRHGWIR